MIRRHAPRFLPGNHIELLHNGDEFFPALIAAIDQAECEVRLETYLFANDAIGRQVVGALAAAAQRGVTVKLLVDGFGAHNFMADFGERLMAAGVQVLVYRPEVSRFRLRRHRLRRLHRKLATIDARIAFVGGINIIDDLDTPGQLPPRYDYSVRIEGPLLADIHRVMRRLWYLVRWASLQRRDPLRAPRPVTTCQEEGMTAALLIRDNLNHRHDIEEAYLSAIETARHEVLLANAYFLPGRRFRKALMAAARRGVQVTLLLQGRVEYRLLYYATRAIYADLLAAGVRIFEYRRGFLHAKVAVIDDDWATVGSSNIDPFSLLLAREANVVIRNGAFTAQLRDHLQQTLRTASQEVTVATERRGSWGTRLLESGAYALVRLLIELAGYGNRH